MGFMNKLNKMKSFLFDEEEVEEKRPSKKREKVEKKEIKIEDNYQVMEDGKEEDLFFEDISEEDVSVQTEVHSRVEKEPKFNFPEFDDDDFMVTSKKPEPIVSPVIKEEPKRTLYQGSKRKEEFKKFKPSPIISPIYGLLDDNGNSVKDDSKEKISSYNDEVTIDEVRRKAYGSYDDELENTIERLSKKTIEEAEKEMEIKEKELSREKKKASKIKEEVPIITSLENEEDDEDDDMILPNVNFKEIDVDKESTRSSKKQEAKKDVVKQDEDDEEYDDTKEQDLFNLIDTMYQNKEDEE